MAGGGSCWFPLHSFFCPFERACVPLSRTLGALLIFTAASRLGGCNVPAAGLRDMGPCLWDRVLMFLQPLAEMASIPVRSGTGVDKVALPTELRWPVNGLCETPQ
ncbi:hypothetical protein LX36DRAFT_104224 [Colletotrichum falcatum]|nr:hypothetical protein LX36DRAFT_104224 [Colletotrichum falcatum]